MTMMVKVEFQNCDVEIDYIGTRAQIFFAMVDNAIQKLYDICNAIARKVMSIVEGVVELIPSGFVLVWGLHEIVPGGWERIPEEDVAKMFPHSLTIKIGDRFVPSHGAIRKL